MTTSTLTPFSVVVETSGSYNKFLTALENRIGKAPSGEIRFVLHSDENQDLYIPRKNNSKGRYNLFVNPTNIDELMSSNNEVHNSIAMLLKDRVKTCGYYVIWETANRIFLVPAPSKQTSIPKARGFAN